MGLADVVDGDDVRVRQPRGQLFDDGKRKRLETRKLLLSDLQLAPLDIVFGVGFIFSDDLTQLAKEYPNTKFAGVDYAIATDSTG